jgi:two-component system nitrate/nitrite response regulator NarL
MPFIKPLGDDVLVAAKRAFTELTPREKDVLRHLMIGHSAAETAAILGISSRTAELHRENIRTKFGVHSSLQLVRLMVELDRLP